MDYSDLGELRNWSRIYQNSKGIIDKEVFYITKSLVDRFDGIHVWFRITIERAQQFKRN